MYLVVKIISVNLHIIKNLTTFKYCSNNNAFTSNPNCYMKHSRNHSFHDIDSNLQKTYKKFQIFHRKCNHPKRYYNTT